MTRSSRYHLVHEHGRNIIFAFVAAFVVVVAIVVVIVEISSCSQWGLCQ